MSESVLQKTGLEVIRQLSGQKELSELPEFQQRLGFFKKRFEDDEFRIAVVGEFSSGKSTFINALIGRDVLQHASLETTAAITQLINVRREDSRCGKGCVKLSDGSTVHLQELDELVEYTTTFSKRLKVAAEVVQVELFLPLMPAAEPIVIVDTPGLNGMAGGHRERTMELVQQAHACIYMLPQRGLADTDISSLRQLVLIQKKFIFVQNFIDTLNEDEGDTLEKKLEEQKSILQEKVFQDVPEAEFELCGVSALQALNAQDRNIQRMYKDGPLLTEANRAVLYKNSNFGQFRLLLKETFRPDALEKIKYGSSARALADWLGQLTEQVEQRRERVDALYASSQDRFAVEKLEARAESIRKNQKENETRLQNFVLAMGMELRREEAAAAHAVREAVRSSINQDISRYGQNHKYKEELAHLQSWQKTTLAGDMEWVLNAKFVKLQENLEDKIEAVRQQLQARVEEYAGGAELKLKKARFETTQKVGTGFAAEKSDIERMEEKLKKMRAEEAPAREKMEHLKGEVAPAQQKAEAGWYSWMAERNRFLTEQSELGTRPKAWKEKKIESKPRGGLFGWLLGPKEIVTEKENDDLGKMWDKRKAELNELYEKADELGEKARELQEQAEEVKQQYASAKDFYGTLEKKIRDKQQELEEQRRSLEIKIQTDTINYLNLCKNGLREQVEAYLADDGEPAQQMAEIIDERIRKMEQNYTEQAIQAMRIAVSGQLQRLEAVKAGHRSELQDELEQLAASVDQLRNMQKEMEEKLA